MTLKAIVDPGGALANGLAEVRARYGVPAGFAPEVLAAADVAARRAPSPTEHADWTGRPFVTLDPATSTDLDQAFAIEAPAGSGGAGDIILHYAIADVGWFVADGGALDGEAWRRGTTLYLPDGRAGLYPPVLSERAASLLPDADKAAIVHHVRIDADGAATLDGVTRARIRSRAKLAYESVADADLPAGFAALAARMAAAERARGAVRVDPPEQEMAALGSGRYALHFRPRLPSETGNAALSLATNIAVAKALIARETGLFRVMAPPGSAAIAKLRLSAAALGIDWPADLPLPGLLARLDPADPRHAALMMAQRRAGEGAAYAPFDPGHPPWHAAVAAPYAHATAPLRRLADRYVNRAALAIANGGTVTAADRDAFVRLPAVMARADATAGRINRAVIDLAEAVMLSEAVGQHFAAGVIESDGRRARVQLAALPVVASIAAAGLQPGQQIALTLAAVDVPGGVLTFRL